MPTRCIYNALQRYTRTHKQARLHDLSLLMLRRFFQDYKQLEGKSVEVDEIQPATAAYRIIEDALRRYSEQRRKGFAESKPQSQRV